MRGWVFLRPNYVAEVVDYKSECYKADRNDGRQRNFTAGAEIDVIAWDVANKYHSCATQGQHSIECNCQPADDSAKAAGSACYHIR